MDQLKSKISITSEKEVTIDDLIDEASTMWNKVKKYGIKNLITQERIDELMQQMYREHTNFCKSYPIVNRYMCQFQTYNSKAFRRWLTKISANPWKSRAEYIEASADYVVILYRATHKTGVNATELSNLRTNIISMLTQEYDDFEKETKRALEIVEKQEEMMKKRNAAELHEYAQSLDNNQLEKKLQFVVENDIQNGNQNGNQINNEYINDNQNIQYKVNKMLDNVETTKSSFCADDLL